MAGRTAVVAGTATAVSGRVARRQNEKYQSDAASQQAAQQEQYQQAPQQAPEQAYSSGQEAPSMSSELERLGTMRQQGLLTDEEFAAAKSKLIGS